MADLMTGTYTYESLKRKYGEFAVPAAKIKIGGTNIVGTKGFQLEEMEVSLSLEAASSVTFRLVNCYDVKNSTFDSKVKGKMVLGTVVEVELGYLSSTVSIFKGFISSVGVDFDVDDTIAYEITAMDVRRLMMTDYHYLLHHVKNYSEAFETVMKPYKKLCTVSTEATNDKLEVPLSQSISDYDFVMKELIGKGRAEREFFVLGSKAYFRKPQNSKTSIMTIGIGKGLKSFQRSETYLNQKIKVIGYDPSGKKDIKGEATAKAVGNQVNALSSSGEIVIVDADIETEKKAKERAAAIAGGMKARSMQGTITCIGIPEIVPGRYIKMDKMDSNLNKEYYITAVKHNYGEDGFITTFEVGGCKV